MSKKDKKVLIIVSLSIIVLGIISVWLAREEQERETSSSYVQKEKSESLEYKLATIEKGYVSRDDIIITRFRSILRQLDNIYVEGKQEISDLTVFAVQKLLRDKYGINESLLNVMEGLNQINPSRENPEYRMYATAYVQLRNQGFIHQEAINKVESYLDSIGR
jgi:lipopolysaccharide export system protein LptC